MSGELSIMLPPERVGLLGFKGLQYDTRVVHRVGGEGFTVSHCSLTHFGRTSIRANKRRTWQLR